MKTYKIQDYRINAINWTEACKVLANLGLLKGHRLQMLNGSIVEVEYLNFTKNGEGTFYKKIPSINGRVVFYVSENYHSPDRFKVFRSNDGTYATVFESRTGRISRQYGLKLAEVFSEAKAICKNFKVPFEGFLPLEKDYMKDSIYKGIYFGRLSLLY